MALGDVLARLSVVLGLDTATFEQGATITEKRLTQMARKFEAMGKGFVDLGQKMTVGLTLPLAAFGVTAIKAAAESQDALGQVEAALTSMGDASGRTKTQLAGLAEGLMRNSLYDDDEILRKVTANLLTFGNVAGEQFDKAQQAAVDLAARMGTDLQSATLTIGKALNDPVKGLQALRRVGIQFTDQQKEQISAMAEAGDMAGAQTVMLKELERQFGNSAKAARAANPLAALKQSFAEFQETVGGHLMKVLPAITGALERMLDAFSRLSPGMQQALIIGAGLAAAFGPLLVVMGSLVQLAAPVLAAFSAISAAGGVILALKSVFAGFVAVLGPGVAIIAAVAAAGALIYANWDKIGPVLAEVWQYFQQTLGPPLQELITAVTALFTELWNGPLGDLIKVAGKALLEFGATHAKVLGPAIITGLKLVIGVFAEFVRVVADGVRAVARLFEGDLVGAGRAVASMINRVFFGIPEAVGRMVIKVRDWLVNKLGAVWDTVRQKIEYVKDLFLGLYDAVVGHSYIPDMVDGIAAQMARLDEAMVKPAKTATERTKEYFEKLRDDIRVLLDKLYPEARELVEFRKDLATIEKGEKAKQLTPEQAKQARRDLIFAQIPTDTLEKVEGSVEKAGDVVAGWAKKAKEANDKVKLSFADMAQDVSSSLQNLASSIKGGGVLDIFTSVIDLLLQLGSFGVFGKGIQANLNAPRVPGFAGGTGFAPGGLSLVGERGPELVDLPRGSRVIPNNKLRDQRPYFDLRGAVLTSDLLAQMNRIGQATGMGGAMAGAQIAESRILKRGRRRIPG